MTGTDNVGELPGAAPIRSAPVDAGEARTYGVRHLTPAQLELAERGDAARQAPARAPSDASPPRTPAPGVGPGRGRAVVGFRPDGGLSPTTWTPCEARPTVGRPGEQGVSGGRLLADRLAADPHYELP